MINNKHKCIKYTVLRFIVIAIILTAERTLKTPRIPTLRWIVTTYLLNFSDLPRSGLTKTVPLMPTNPSSDHPWVGRSQNHRKLASEPTVNTDDPLPLTTQHTNKLLFSPLNTRCLRS